jgi:hypothetical protein
MIPGRKKCDPLFKNAVSERGLRDPYDHRYEELRFELQALSTRCSCYARPRGPQGSQVGDSLSRQQPPRVALHTLADSF